MNAARRAFAARAGALLHQSDRDLARPRARLPTFRSQLRVLRGLRATRAAQAPGWHAPRRVLRRRLERSLRGRCGAGAVRCDWQRARALLPRPRCVPHRIRRLPSGAGRTRAVIGGRVRRASQGARCACWCSSLTGRTPTTACAAPELTFAGPGLRIPRRRHPIGRERDRGPRWHSNTPDRTTRRCRTTRGWTCFRRS